MKYKMVKFDKTNIFFYDKESVFKFVDLNKYDIRVLFSEFFNFNGRNGYFKVLKSEYDSYNSLYERYTLEREYLYFDGFYILYDEKNRKVNLDDFIEDYFLSRNLNKKTNRKRFFYDTSTSKSRKEEKHAKYLRKGKNNSFKKEYQEYFYASEYNVKVRNKRLDEIVKYHVFFYEDDYYEKTSRCWKNKKIKKQYLKNI